MPKKVDRVGVRYGRLVAICDIGRNSHGKRLWECVCDCGATVRVVGSSLSSGNTHSCGCLSVESITTHGGSNKSSYNTWRAMMRRCYNEKDKDYSRYGARGIYVHLPWHDYETFAYDMGEPIGNETLDRIQPNSGYVPGNCRWASPTIQARNIQQHTNIGVRLRGKRWYGEVSVARKKIYTKGFNTVEEARAARSNLIAIYWGSKHGFS
jgi:hypothetical protein